MSARSVIANLVGLAVLFAGLVGLNALFGNLSLAGVAILALVMFVASLLVERFFRWRDRTSSDS